KGRSPSRAVLILSVFFSSTLPETMSESVDGATPVNVTNAIKDRSVFHRTRRITVETSRASHAGRISGRFHTSGGMHRHPDQRAAATGRPQARHSTSSL